MEYFLKFFLKGWTLLDAMFLDPMSVASGHVLIRHNGTAHFVNGTNLSSFFGKMCCRTVEEFEHEERRSPLSELRRQAPGHSKLQTSQLKQIVLQAGQCSVSDIHQE